MGVNRSGYYKWLNKKELNQYQKDRIELINEIKEEQQRYPYVGYL